jgi:2-polyprenyl-3-methyl-5-hydroxy-6-metoxy-1,4-benzoquinol methylase
MRLNIKNFGYLLARQMKEAGSNGEVIKDFSHVGLKSKPTTQVDMESDWVKYWCGQLHLEPIYHRKLWELCYVSQAIKENFELNENMRGIGFGCGEEPLASLFASMGPSITVTDLHPDQVAGMGWAETKQHTDGLEKAYYDKVIDKSTFQKKVDLQYVDMNNIPERLHGKFDFCWSVCALEHLGSIQNGLDFMHNSLKVLKPGGIAVHTTEYNYTNVPDRLDNWSTVLFHKTDFEEVAAKMSSDGHFVSELDFDTGDQPVDLFIDIPPFDYGTGWYPNGDWGSEQENNAHLKLSVDGYPCTCFGMIVKKGQA